MSRTELSRVAARAISALGLDWHVVNVSRRANHDWAFEFEDGSRLRTVTIKLEMQPGEPEDVGQLEAALKMRLRQISTPRA